MTNPINLFKEEGAEQIPFNVEQDHWYEFVKLFNKANGCKLSFKEASKNTQMKELYDTVVEALVITAESLDIDRKIYKNSSTSSRSYNSTNLNSVDRKVFELVQNYAGATRSELVAVSKIKLQTLTGAVTRLMNSNLIKVSGHIHDNSTNRRVECLVVA